MSETTVAKMAEDLTEWVTTQFATNEAWLAWLAAQDDAVRQGFDVVASVVTRIDDDGWPEGKVEIAYSLIGVRDRIEAVYQVFVVTGVQLPDSAHGINEAISAMDPPKW